MVILVVAYKKPFVAISLWLWTGIFVPVYWLYGFAELYRYNLIFSALGIGCYFIYQKDKEVKFDSLLFVIILFFLHTTLTTITTIAVPDVVWVTWENFMKVVVLTFFITLTFRKKIHFELLIWIMVLSIGFFGLIEGLKFIKSGGVHHIHGPVGHILSDNNHLAIAILMVIPLACYLYTQLKEKWIKMVLAGFICICVLSVFGTQSRGGFLGLLIVGGYFWLKAKRKILLLCLFALLAFSAPHLLHESWFARMSTIENAVEEDGSFQTRLIAWKIHTIMAIERPVLGGGFKSSQFGYIWRELAEKFYLLDFIPTPPAGSQGWAAHSIYFQVLGDHGFVGLFLFLLIMVLAFLKLSAIEKYYKGQWQAHLGAMIKVSLLAFCAAGAAVSLSYFELYYVLLAMIICFTLMKNKAQKAQAAAEKAAKLAQLNPAPP